MKKLKLFAVAVIAAMFFAVKADAQTAPTYFAGKWDVLVKGTPNGDVHLKFNVTEKDGALTSTIENPETQKEEPVAKTELKEGQIYFSFRLMDYDLVLHMAKKDDDHTTGSLVDMFEAVGERVK